MNLRLIDAYIASIRNQRKRAYAQAYFDWLRADENGEAPKPIMIGTMAAQAVRMRLYELCL